jgi:hypothetical protein
MLAALGCLYTVSALGCQHQTLPWLKTLTLQKALLVEIDAKKFSSTDTAACMWPGGVSDSMRQMAGRCMLDMLRGLHQICALSNV